MKYIENPDDTENSEDEDDFIKSLKKQIAAIKRSREWEGRFVLLEEMISDERKEARAEGWAEGLAEGRTKGLAEGRAEGITEGQSKANKLVQLLAQQNRMDDIIKAANDSEYQEQLFKEFNL